MEDVDRCMEAVLKIFKK